MLQQIFSRQHDYHLFWFIYKRKGKKGKGAFSALSGTRMKKEIKRNEEKKVWICLRKTFPKAELTELEVKEKPGGESIQELCT